MLDCLRNIFESCFETTDKTPLLTPNVSNVKASCSALLLEIQTNLESSKNNDLTQFLVFKNACNHDLNSNRLVTFENFQNLVFCKKRIYKSDKMKFYRLLTFENQQKFILVHSRVVNL